jgi:hypothetical protein
VTAAAARPARGPSCASDLELNALMAGELDEPARAAALKAHVDSCPRCRARLDRFQAVAIPPFAELDAAAPAAPAVAATVAAPRGGTAPRSGPRWRARAGWGAAVAAAAMAAAVAFLVRPRSTGPDGTAVRTKGGELVLAVLRRTPSGAVEALAPGASVGASDTIRFQLGHAQAGYALVLGIDSRRSVSIYVPSPADQQPPFLDVAGTTVLPGAIALDDAPGAEHVIALLCPSPPPVAEVRLAVAARLADPAVGAGDVRGLRPGCDEASFVIRKPGAR